MSKAGVMSVKPRVSFLASRDVQFGLVLLIIAVAVAVWPLVSGAPPRWWGLAAAAVIALIVLFAPALLAPPRRAMEWLGHYLGIINTFTLLALIYFLLLTPMAFFMRLSGRDALRIRGRAAPASYWAASEAQWSADSFKRQF